MKFITWNKHFIWDQYFKDVGIYQGRCHWHDLKDLVMKLKNKTIKTLV